MRYRRYMVVFQLEDGESADGLGDRLFEAISGEPNLPRCGVANMEAR